MANRSSYSELTDQILGVLTGATRPLLAREIAELVSEKCGVPVDKRTVNSILYSRELKLKVRQDKSYRWDLASRLSEESARRAKTTRRPPKKPDRSPAWERFDRLASYYLECILEDEGTGARFFLTDDGNKFLTLPLRREWSLRDQNTFALEIDSSRSRFAGQLRQRGQVGALFYGYPMYVDWIARSRSGWTGGFALPVFLEQVDFELDRDELRISLQHDWPRLNPEFAQKAFSSPDERRDFLAQLGLLETEGEPPEEGLTDIVRRMVQLDLVPVAAQEKIDPESLSEAPATAELNSPGLFNRALLVIGERSRYTQGLEHELEALRDSVKDAELERSALRLFFGGSGATSAESPAASPSPLIEVVPLNDEQRDAVQSAFESPLTVVTGPPGTGKSQIVATILANAYLRGERVLFTSRNHKAVDVVETRVNGLASLPIVVRTGGRSGERNLQAELLQFLSQALSTSATDEDRRAAEDARTSLARLESDRKRLWVELEGVRKARNRVDVLDQQLAKPRQELPEETWKELFSVRQLPTTPGLETALELAQEHLDRTAGLLKKFFLRFRRSKDFRRIGELSSSFRRHPELFGELPPSEPSFDNLRAWRGALELALDRFRLLAVIVQYHRALGRLSELSTPSDLAERLARIEDELWTWSASLIATHGKLLPDRLNDPALRRALGEYRATVQRLAEDQVGGRAYAQVRREEQQLFEKVAQVLPVWCVTNLSARGSLPFDASLFDLAVIDEASQCDIPSALPLFFRAKRAVVIGDPNQLRHISTLERHRDQLLQNRYELTTAADQPFTFSNNSLFDLAASTAEGRVIGLREHFRSHADIVAFSNRHWYQDRLKICTDYRRLKRVDRGGPGIVWTTARGKVVRPSAGGALSQAEVAAVVNELELLLRERDFRGTVGVVTPFRIQANRLRDQITQRLDLSLIERAALIVDTAHGFQGDERDVILFSPCVGPEMPRGAKYFLASTGNLFNVAITRARTLLHVIGDQEACSNCGIPHIEGFAAYVANLHHDSGPEPSTPQWDAPGVGYWERPFFEALVDAGLRPMHQYRVHQYRLDFAIVDGDFKLNIETDGELYHKEWDGSRSRSDLIRDLRLSALGWAVKRFWAYQLRDDMERCVQGVLELVDARCR